MCVWCHHDHFPFSQNHSCNSCAPAIAFGSDKQSKCCRTHRVVVIAMKSKGNNNKPILKVVTTKTLQPPKRYHSADVCLSAVTRPRRNAFAFIFIISIRLPSHLITDGRTFPLPKFENHAPSSFSTFSIAANNNIIPFIGIVIFILHHEQRLVSLLSLE